MIAIVTDAATQPHWPERFCDACGYNLRGLTSDRCPEFDPDAPPIAQIPWLRRKQIGTWRAYWQTVFAVTFHPIQFARETAKVGSASDDATRFRRLIIWQAAVSVALFAAILLPVGGGAVRLLVTALLAGSAIGIAAGVFFFLATALLPMTGHESWNLPRLRVLNCYRCAPCAFLALMLVPICLLIVFASPRLLIDFVIPSLFYGSICLFFVVWLNAILMLCAVNEYRLRNVVEVVILIPIMWTWAGLASICVGMLTLTVAGGAFDVLRNFLD